MTLTNPPVQAAALTYNRVFIERGGFVYIGYQNKPLVTNVVRLNTTAATALLSQLGVTAENPSVPLALTAGSYTGTWDVRGAAESVTSSSGITISLNANGSRSCFDKGTASAFACSVTFTNAATGAFTFFGEGYGAASGNFNFLSGTASGMSTSTPTDIYAGGRR